MLKYYESYRASVIADALPGFTDFAKTTPTKTSQFENFSDYLTHVTNAIAYDINHNDKTNALRWIREHQYAVKAMFEKMVEGYRNPFEYGWKSYKFSNAIIEFDKFTLLPNLMTKHNTNKPIVYGAEMEVLSGLSENATIIADKILETKQNGPCFMQFVLNERRLRRHELATINKETVVDWTGVI